MKIGQIFTKPFILLNIFLIILFIPLLEAQTGDQFRKNLFQKIDSLIEKADQENAEILAPLSYSEGLEHYRQAEQMYEKGGNLKKIESNLAEAEYYFSISIESAKVSRIALKDILEMRSVILQNKFNEMAPKSFSKAEKELMNTAKKIEQGDFDAGRKRSGKIAELYRETTISAYKDGYLKQAEKSLERRADELYITEYRQSKKQLKDAGKWLDDQDNDGFRINDFILEADSRIGSITGVLYPAWYRNMPDTLLLGEFELIVNQYDDKGQYDFTTNTTSGASGTAQVHFNCGLHFFLPAFTGTAQFITQPFTVVEIVEDPLYEISVMEARKFKPEVVTGSEISIPLVKESVDKFGILKARDQLLGTFEPLPPKSGITVKFENATISPGDRLTLGDMISGSAAYPTNPAFPEVPAKLFVEGFRIAMDSLYIDNTGAVANARLHLPVSIIDGAGCSPAIIDLGSISISPDCQFYKEMPDSTFGPFITDKTGMIFAGQGIIVDFNKVYSPSGYSLDADWRGVILQSGQTIAASSGSVISNSGYLQAEYRFNNGLVTWHGLKARFNLNAAYQFNTLVPYDYTVAMSSGYIDVDSSAVQSGQITSGQLRAPEKAVCYFSPGQQLTAYFTNMNIQKDLDLVGSVTLSQDIFWGELTHSGKEFIPFTAKPNTSLTDHAWFYLNGKATGRFVPQNDADFLNSVFWGDIGTKLENKQIAGLTIMQLAELTIYTPDISGTPKELKFVNGTGCSLSQTWINIETLGINGQISISLSSRNEKLGDENTAYYKSSVPFDIDLACISQKERCFFLRFSSSALYDSEFHGIIKLKGACNTTIPFVDLELTSTAQLVGGDIDLSGGPVVLEYWKVELVETSPGDPAGALSVRTGQIILTQAGIKEDRHFAKPFKLIWGELLADGNMGELFFDYNSADQKFDGFLFTPHYVALSEYDTSILGYLEVCGNNHFEFFGSNYLSIQDSVYEGTDPAWGGRSIGIIDKESDYCESSNMNLSKNWGNGASIFDFELEYDKNDQDGFLGEGIVAMPDHFQDNVTASIQMDRDDTLIGLIASSGNNFMLMGVDIGAAAEMWGCIDIEGQTLSCIMLGFTLESTSQSAFGLLGGAGGMIEAKTVIKPTITTFAAAGMMYVDMGLGGNVSVSGSILLTTDQAAGSVYGDLQGDLDFSSICAGLEANGHINWYLSPVTQYVQGRAGISVYGRSLGSAGLTGGIFIGNNVPKNEVWVLTDGSNHYAVDLSQFPSHITGVYGFGQVSVSLDFGIFAGGIEIYAGLGAFVNMEGVELCSSMPGVPLPYILSNFGVKLHGEILWGLVSASAWCNLQIMVGDPFYFQGTCGLEGCVAWVVCASADVTITLNEDGFDID
ncbi:MAG: hypothetical protein APR54_01825 [Candidatus Cloacimonas sp. SDB]|nr:MAG: hypothetical protein APR54_01825 [Candidatus Cloacimonas sp. SDB]